MGVEDDDPHKIEGEEGKFQISGDDISGVLECGSITSRDQVTCKKVHDFLLFLEEQHLTEGDKVYETNEGIVQITTKFRSIFGGDNDRGRIKILKELFPNNKWIQGLTKKQTIPWSQIIPLFRSYIQLGNKYQDDELTFDYPEIGSVCREEVFLKRWNVGKDELSTGNILLGQYQGQGKFLIGQKDGKKIFITALTIGKNVQVKQIVILQITTIDTKGGGKIKGKIIKNTEYGKKPGLYLVPGEVAKNI